MGLAHRILVFRNGRIVGEFKEGTANREELLTAAFGTGSDGVGLSVSKQNAAR